MLQGRRSEECCLAGTFLICLLSRAYARLCRREDAEGNPAQRVRLRLGAVKLQGNQVLDDEIRAWRDDGGTKSWKPIGCGNDRLGC